MGRANTIKIKPMSVNQVWQGKRFKRKEYEFYEQELILRLPNINVADGKLKVYLEFGMSNSNSDWDNPIKPFVDVLQKKYNFNDNKIYEAHVKKVKVDKGQEYISFSLEALPQ